jgi:hypothetical protein
MTRPGTSSNPKFEAALAHAKRGFSVFPLAPNSKVPPEGFNGWQFAASTDESRIRRWWKQWPDANIAILTTDLLVVDMDPRNGGVESMATLRLMDDVPKTRTATTWRGGAHFVYALPAHVSVKSGTHVLGPGLDVKGRNQYIVAAGSTIDGKPYQWADTRELATAPQWMIDACAKGRERGASAGKRLVEEDDEAVRLARAWIERYAPSATLGNLKNSGYYVAAWCYDYGVSRPTCEELLLWWSELKCNNEFLPDTAASTARSAEKNRDMAIGFRHPLAKVFERVEIDESLNPYLRATGPSVKPPRLQSVPAAKLAAQALTAVGQPLIKGVLDRNTTSAIYGPSGSGKTFGALDKAYHVHKGADWCGKRVHQGSVLYLAAEGGPGINKRLRALESKYGPLDPTRFHVIPARVDLLHGNDAREVYAEIQRLENEHGHKIELVVVDTLSRVMPGGDENGPQDMTRIVATLDGLREAAKTHVQMVHHTGKDVNKGLRGHSSLIAAVDTEIQMNQNVFTVKKQRDMEGQWSMGFALEVVNLGENTEGERVTSCTIAFRDSRLGRETVPLTGEHAELFNRVIAALEAQYAEQPERVYSEPVQMAVILECATNLPGKNGFAHFESKEAFRRNVSRLWATCAESGHVEKIEGKQGYRLLGQSGQK